MTHIAFPKVSIEPKLISVYLKKSSPDVFRQLLGLGFASVHLAYFHPKIKIIFTAISLQSY